ncbi:MAG: GWxTD domain-containing protein [Ignavibacteria bacterium]|nr:GWxTD domain-containing protein [Ignavibacteria bacterium]
MKPNSFKAVSIAVMILLAGLSFSQDAELKNADINSSRDLFYADPLVFYPQDSAKGRLDLYIEIPLENLMYKKNNATDHFDASVEYNITIKNSSDEIKLNQTYNETISTTKTEQKILNERSASNLKNFFLSSGKYKIIFTFKDKNNNNEKTKEYGITVKNPLIENTLISDILFLSEYKEDASGEKEIVPLISGNVGMLNNFYLFYEVRNNGTDIVTKTYKVKFTDDKDKFVFDTTFFLTLQPGKNSIVNKILNDKYYIGSYKLEISDGSELIGSKPFFYKWLDMPVNLKDLDKAVEQMRYIASEDILDYIKKAKTRDEKLKRFLKFWKDNDPTPNTPKNELMNVYYTRVKIATEKYTHYVEGWKTDMGMVYIMFGTPGNIERHPFESDSKPYEIWTYYDINREFVFVDDTGFGDYRLLTPIYDDRTRIRY